MSKIEMFVIRNMPRASHIWQTLGSNFNNLSQAVCELVDNAISNLRRHAADLSLSRTIRIAVRDLGDRVEISVEDGGTGIRDLDNAMTLAGMVGQETTLNEHGYGLKHTFAYMDSSGGEWLLATRTHEDAEMDRYRKVHPPYDFGFESFYGIYDSGWIGTLNRTGTYIRLTCPMNVFETLAMGSQKKLTFRDLIAVLEENLSYTYARILAEESIRIELTVADSKGSVTKLVEPIFPEWIPDTLVELPDQVVDLGGGNVRLECRYGTIVPNEDACQHYAGNMESSGVEISINNRVIEHGLINQIWGRKIHPSMNNFLAQVNLVADSRGALPATKTAKNGFREEHPFLKELYKRIKASVPEFEEKKSEEDLLLDKLAEKKRNIPGAIRVTREERTFRTLGINLPMDLFVYGDDKISIFEGKAKRSSPQSVAQLVMYWNGCAQDENPADEGILIARDHPRSVLNLLDYYNGSLDPSGRRYNLRAITWDDEGISA